MINYLGTFQKLSIYQNSVLQKCRSIECNNATMMQNISRV